MDLHRTKKVFIFCQAMILGLGCLLAVFVIGTTFVRRESQSREAKLERTAQFLLQRFQEEGFVSPGGKAVPGKKSLHSIEGDLSEQEYIALTGDRGAPSGPFDPDRAKKYLEEVAVPLGEAFQYVLFVFDQKGNEVIPRTELNTVDAKLWDRYKPVLIYEMGKKRQGRAVYPESGKESVTDGQKVIRYMPLHGTDWMLALEAPFPGTIPMVKKLLNTRTVLLLLAVFFGVFVFSWFMVQFFFSYLVRTMKGVAGRDAVAMNYAADTASSPLAFDMRRFEQRLDYLSLLVNEELKRSVRQRDGASAEASAVGNAGMEEVSAEAQTRSGVREAAAARKTAGYSGARPADPLRKGAAVQEKTPRPDAVLPERPPQKTEPVPAREGNLIELYFNNVVGK